jgi:NAD+ synthase
MGEELAPACGAAWAQTERGRIVAFLREQLAQARHERLVLGMSGGIDSALVAALGVEAVGAENVLGMIMPYRGDDPAVGSNPESEAHARLAIERLGMPCNKVDIGLMVDALVARLPDMSAGRKGNLMARCRMMVLYDQSVVFRGLVAGTSNRTETLLGYFTLHGDGAAALKPIAHLYKCQVRALACEMDVPEVIVAKPPSADLWAGQTDEGELGFAYDLADRVLYLHTERGLGEAEIAHALSDGMPGDAARLPILVAAILGRMRAMAFKRRLPPELPPANA